MNISGLYNLAKLNGWQNDNPEFEDFNTVIFDSLFIKCLLIDFDIDKLPLNSSIHSDLVYHRPDLYLIMHLVSLNSPQERLDLLLKIFA